jgi:hypothetical protein
MRHAVQSVYMRFLAIGLACTGLIASLIGCGHRPKLIAAYDRNHDGLIDAWVYRIDGSDTEHAFDTDADSKVDVIQLYHGKTLVKTEEDRNHDGRIDLVQEYYDGKLSRVVRDDNFDGKPETIEIYRNGKLAMVEHDPDGSGVAQTVDYYENSRLIRTEHLHPKN